MKRWQSVTGVKKSGGTVGEWYSATRIARSGGTVEQCHNDSKM